VVSKGLTGGFLPMATVLTTDRLYEVFIADWNAGRAFLHSNTYAGNALAVAVALAALDVYASDDVLGHVARAGPLLRQGLADLATEHAPLHDVRGIGMMAAVDLRAADGSPLNPQQRTGWRFSRTAAQRGVLLRSLGDTCYLFPPLTTTAEEIRWLLRAFSADGFAPPCP
jgi:adenosylmethionine-8-amino-7-oxononanoate aminotransferase